MNTTTNLEIDAINKFILDNAEETQPWVALYEEKRRKWDIDKKIIQVVSWYKHAFSKSFKRKYANDLSQQLGCKPSQREIWCIHSLPTEEEDVLNIGIG